MHAGNCDWIALSVFVAVPHDCIAGYRRYKAAMFRYVRFRLRIEFATSEFLAHLYIDAAADISPTPVNSNNILVADRHMPDIWNGVAFM